MGSTYLELYAALFPMQATQLLAQRIDIGLGRIQRDLPLRRQPSASLAAQPVILLSPLRGLPVAFLRQRLALFVLRQAVAGVRQQRRRAAEEALQAQDVLQGGERIRAVRAPVRIAAQEASLEFIARQQFLAAQCGLFEQQ